MTLYSFIEEDFYLKEIAIEIELIPGLPGIRILGQPDSVIKESQYRILSAFNALGFELPNAEQVIVSLNPPYGLKRSHGLDLAIALGILLITEQIPLAVYAQLKKIYAYGALKLSGEVDSSSATKFFVKDRPRSPVLVGGASSLPFDCGLEVNSLAELSAPREVTFERGIGEFQRPTLPKQKWEKELGQFIIVAAIGEHSALAAGPPGTGKTTLMAAIYNCLQDLKPRRAELVMRLAHYFGTQQMWRPLVEPHHSVSIGGLIGGGGQLRAGAVSQAHGGVLLLDELLEFEPRVLDVLREPMESGHLKIFRNGKWRKLPAQDLTLATTNLCSCGQWMPPEGGVRQKCRCGQQRLKRYHGRLSGPLLDRFSMVQLIRVGETNGPFEISELLERVLESTRFKTKRKFPDKNNARLQLFELEELVEIDIFDLKQEYQLSERRWLHWLRVARSIADLYQSSKIEMQHMMTAYNYAVRPFVHLQEHMLA